MHEFSKNDGIVAFFGYIKPKNFAARTPDQLKSYNSNCLLFKENWKEKTRKVAKASIKPTIIIIFLPIEILSEKYIEFTR